MIKIYGYFVPAFFSRARRAHFTCNAIAHGQIKFYSFISMEQCVCLNTVFDNFFSLFLSLSTDESWRRKRKWLFKLSFRILLCEMNATFQRNIEIVYEKPQMVVPKWAFKNSFCYSMPFSAISPRESGTFHTSKWPLKIEKHQQRI